MVLGMISVVLRRVLVCPGMVLVLLEVVLAIPRMALVVLIVVLLDPEALGMVLMVLGMVLGGVRAWIRTRIIPVRKR